MPYRAELEGTPGGFDRRHLPNAENHLPMRAAWGHLLCSVQTLVSHGQQHQCLGLPSFDRL